jgi:hypothetical protein
MAGLDQHIKQNIGIRQRAVIDEGYGLVIDRKIQFL